MTTVSRAGPNNRLAKEVTNSSSLVFVGTNATPYIHMYDWNENGFGALYPAPSVLPTGVVTSISVTPDQEYLVCAVSSETNRQQVYYRITNGGLVFVKGFTAADNVTRTATISKAGKHVAFSGISGSMRVYNLDKYAGIGTQLTGVATAVGRQCEFDNSGSRIAWARTTSPYVQVFNFSTSSGVQSAFANTPSGVGTTAGRALRWTASDSHIVLLRSASSGNTLEAYPVNVGGGLGTRASSVAAVNGTSLSLSDASGIVGVTLTASPYVQVHPRSSGTLGVKLANPAELAGATCNDGSITSDGNTFFAASNDANVVHAWPVSDEAFGVRYPFPISLPSGDGYSVMPLLRS